MSERRQHAKDLGELMVVAHALVKAEQGQDVTVVIDEQAGARMASVEARNLDRRRAAGRPVGRIRLAAGADAPHHLVEPARAREAAETDRVGA